MTLLAAWSLYLSRITRQEEVVVGSPIANRQRKEIEGLIGLFVNTIVLHTDLSETTTFGELLQQVKQTTLDAYTHQDLPLDILVDDLLDERHPSHMPLFQVMFVLQNAPGGALELGELTVETLANDNDRAIADIVLSLAEGQKGISGRWQFNSQLFERSTIERMTAHFEVLLQAIVAQPDTPIQQLPLLPEQERQQLLFDWNATAVSYPTDTTFVQQFEAQAGRTPTAVAIVYKDQKISYDQLNRRANQIARLLQEKEIGPEMLVGLCVERSPAMLIGILAILKTGAAYLPLDTTYPVERLDFMLSDAQVSLTLTDSQTEKTLAALLSERSTIVLDTVAGQEATAENLPPLAAPENLAYCIYTSGSTGKPKGVLIEHRHLLNYLFWAVEAYELEQGMGAPVNTPIGF